MNAAEPLTATFRGSPSVMTLPIMLGILGFVMSTITTPAAVPAAITASLPLNAIPLATPFGMLSDAVIVMSSLNLIAGEMDA